MFLIENPPRRKSPLGPETAGQRERWRPFGWGGLRCRTAHPGGGSKFLLTRPVCQGESVTASSSLAGWAVLSRSEGRGCSAGAVSFLRVVCSPSPTARNSSLTPISEPHDLPFSSHISCTLNTDTQSQSRNNSPTVQHRKLRPSPETDPLSAANHFGGSLTKDDKYTNKQQK